MDVGVAASREGSRRFPRWLGPVAGGLIVLGVGLALPTHGQLATVPADEVATVREIGWFAPPPGRLLTPVRPRWSPYAALPVSGESPGPMSILRQRLLPLAGPDPLTLPWCREPFRYRSPLAPLPLSPAARRARVPVVYYHDVVPGALESNLDISGAELDRDFDRLAREGATPISLDQWWRYITAGQALPAKPILLTFDDGYAGCYTEVFPRLRQRGWPAVFFIVTGTVGQRTTKDHVTWSQLLEMQRSGLCDIQAHTVTHAQLHHLKPAQLHREVTVCRRVLEQHLRRPVQFFCYPAGFRNPQVIAELKAAGFVAAFTVDAGYSADSPGMFEIRRFRGEHLARALSAANCPADLGG